VQPDAAPAKSTITTWEPCCPRCHRALADVSDGADPAVLGTCPVHGDVQSGVEWWGEPLSEETHRAAANGVEALGGGVR
jgi:hypothetical protein